MRYRWLTLTAAIALAAAAHAEDVAGIPGLTKVPTTMEEAKAEVQKLEKFYEGKKRPEAVKMLVAISRGSKMLSGEGWFGPAESRYGYKWLAERAKLDPKESKKGLPADKFKLPKAWLEKLDRNKDGKVMPDDLDWSNNSSFVQISFMVNRLHRVMDKGGEGKLSKKDLLEFFDKASGGKDYLTSDDLRDAMMAGMSGGFSPGDEPKSEVLLKGLFAGEIGSLREGPKVGDKAPDFELPAPDGKTTMKLSNVVGKAPVVLVFGNFTCGPFRSMYPMVEEVQKRYAKDATFLMVYVREAHPTDGWRMTSNDKVGVSVSQPKSNEERCGVAGRCAKLLKPTMPLLVDGVDDKVGNAYSGMPARLYVLDKEGKVAYKSGRGPFGFKVGEMEQALVMALLEAR